MSDELNEGDIFHWQWTPERLAAIQKVKSDAYWCRSRIAVVKNSCLCDTYWGSSSDSALNPAELILEFQGNLVTMQRIEPYLRVFYRQEDLVDMRQANNSGAPVYVKAGKARDKETMLEFYRYGVEQARRAIELAQRHIAEFDEAIAKIERDEIDGSFPIYSRGR